MIFRTPHLTDAEHRAIAQIDDLRRTLRWRVAEPRRWFGGLRRLTFAKAVQGSNSIEGYHASIEDVLAAVDDEETLDATTETVRALQGYRDAMTYVLQLVEEDAVEITAALLKSLHFMMLKHELSKWPGRWRPGTVFVRREDDGEVVYEGPDADSVPTLVDELVADLAAGDGPVLVRAAMAHLNLVMIHPFKDGNGRMARCLQTLVLARDGIVAPVFSSIEEHLGRNTQDYYDVLADVGQGSWHPERDARPWIRFCLNAHHQQASTTLWRVQEAEELWCGCEQLVEERGLPSRTVGPLCDAARGFRLRNASYRTAVQESEGEELDAQVASRDLRALVEAGLLEATGATRGRYYVATAPLREVYRAVRRQKPSAAMVDLFPEERQQTLEFEADD